ncbi:MAG: RepB family plasmid replication initiator protein [Sarcina sp.]
MEKYKTSDLKIKNKFSLSENEKKIAELFISLVDSKYENQEVNVFMETLKQYLIMDEDDIKKILKSLSGKVLELTRGDDEFIINAFSYIKISDKKKEVSFKFNNQIEGLYKKLMDIYIKSSKFKMESLNGKYSWIIYELISKIPDKKEYYISIDYLKQILKIDNQYKLYADLKRKVLLYSQREINEKTDIKFSFRERKENKKIIGIWIMIL